MRESFHCSLAKSDPEYISDTEMRGFYSVTFFSRWKLVRSGQLLDDRTYAHSLCRLPTSNTLNPSSNCAVWNSRLPANICPVRINLDRTASEFEFEWKCRNDCVLFMVPVFFFFFFLKYTSVLHVTSDVIVLPWPFLLENVHVKKSKV